LTLEFEVNRMNSAGDGNDPGTDPCRIQHGRVSDAAAEAGLEIRILKMAQSTRTAQEAADAAGCDVAQIVKSLVFENQTTGRLNLLLVSGAHNADMDYISERYGLILKRCEVRRVRDETGFRHRRGCADRSPDADCGPYGPQFDGSRSGLGGRRTARTVSSASIQKR
jgi:hypothetical protein